MISYRKETKSNVTIGIVLRLKSVSVMLSPVGRGVKHPCTKHNFCSPLAISISIIQ